jgi:hypothetical protein
MKSSNVFAVQNEETALCVEGVEAAGLGFILLEEEALEVEVLDMSL